MKKKILYFVGIFALLVAFVLNTGTGLAQGQYHQKHQVTIHHSAQHGAKSKNHAQSHKKSAQKQKTVSHKKSVQKQKPVPTTNTPGMPYVQGTQVFDGSGHPLLLRGAGIESSLNNLKLWQKGVPVSDFMNSNLFNAMAHQWNMNTVRISVSNWIYAEYPSSYMSQLTQVVQEANSAGLYVILVLHDDGHGGSPYGSAANLPKVQDISFWKAVATQFKNNPMVMYDLYNEPQSNSWSQWLNGGGTVDGAQVVGFQTLVNTVRSAGAKQIIVVEPGSAGGNGGLATKGWATVGNDTINDPNIIYSLHVYAEITMTPQQLDQKWGPILNHHPIYFGEWALVTNGPGADGYDHCKTVNHAQADQDVLSFLNYMTSRNANWTAWEFAPYKLIQDYTNFTPTSLDIPWTCGDTSNHAGMGAVVKQFLTTGN
jgi:endoglucanase